MLSGASDREKMPSMYSRTANAIPTTPQSIRYSQLVVNHAANLSLNQTRLLVTVILLVAISVSLKYQCQCETRQTYGLLRVRSSGHQYDDHDYVDITHDSSPDWMHLWCNAAVLLTLQPCLD